MINIFDAEVKDGKLFIGENAVMDIKGIPDKKLVAAIRPEGFIPNDNGSLDCDLIRVEVMGRDISVVASHPVCQSITFRAIIGSEKNYQINEGKISFDILPSKIHLFDKETEKRIRFEV